MNRPRVSPDAVQAAEACARRIAGLIEETLQARQHATLAISGGSTPKPLFDRLARTSLDWTRILLFWVDERCVPADDGASNYGMARRHLIEPARIPEANIHRIQGELAPAEAAARYADEIRSRFGLSPGELPRFDVLHRGIGPDAHTASLFPGAPPAEDSGRIAAAVFAPQFAQWRVTLLPGVLEAARQTVVLAAGADKAEALRAVFREPFDPGKYPAQIAADRAEWFVDEAAAALL